MVFYTLSFIPLMRAPQQYPDGPPTIFWIGIASIICPFIVMALWGLYGLYAALRAWSGPDFRYAVIGQLVAEKFAPRD